MTDPKNAGSDRVNVEIPQQQVIGPKIFKYVQLYKGFGLFSDSMTQTFNLLVQWH